MPYATLADVELAAGGRKRLDELADWDASGSRDESTILAYITGAAAWVDSYVGRQPNPPTLPFPDPVPEVYRWLVAREAVYQLKLARDAATQEDRDDHTERLTFLQAVAAGSVTIPEEPGTPGAGSGRPGIGLRTEDPPEVITRHSLRGFS